MQIAFVGVRGVPALYSGFETAATEIGVRLVHRGHEVTVYCRKGYGDESEPYYRGIRKQYLPRINLKMADTLSHTFFSLLHLCVRTPDVLFVFNSANGPLCVIPRLRGIPFAVNVDGLEWLRGKWPPIGRKYFYFASRFSTKVANAIIADSRKLGQFYENTWKSDWYYASYGAEIEHSRNRAILQEYGLEEDGYFLVVARLEPENNTDLIIRAFERVKTDKKLVVIGGTNFESHYANSLRNTRDTRVKFLGSIYDQERLSEIMCNCFVYIHGHMVGGTNPVLLRALGCGACVAYADVEFNSEVVDGAGIPFPLNEAGASAVFQDLVDRLEQRDVFRTAAPERVRQSYTWDMVADRYEELAWKLCGHPKEQEIAPQTRARVTASARDAFNVTRDRWPADNYPIEATGAKPIVPDGRG